MGKVLIFKPKVGKVKTSQTTGEFTVICHNLLFGILDTLFNLILHYTRNIFFFLNNNFCSESLLYQEKKKELMLCIIFFFKCNSQKINL